MTANRTMMLSIPGREQPELPTFYTHGVWGGVTPAGELVAYVYQETQPFPGSFNVEVDTKTGRAIRDEGVERTAVERVAVAKLIIPVPVAHALIEWLKARVEAVAQIQSMVSEQQRQSTDK